MFQLSVEQKLVPKKSMNFYLWNRTWNSAYFPLGNRTGTRIRPRKWNFHRPWTKRVIVRFNPPAVCFNDWKPETFFPFPASNSQSEFPVSSCRFQCSDLKLSDFPVEVSSQSFQSETQRFQWSTGNGKTGRKVSGQ